MFFQANDGIHGNELWRSNGTAEGTFLLNDITPGPGSDILYAQPHLSELIVVNGKLYFYGVNDNIKLLWISDGTINGTRPLLSLDSDGFYSHSATAFSGYTFFFRDAFYLNGNLGFSISELWRTDGTPEGTSKIKDISTAGYYSNFIPAVNGSNLNFVSDDALWKTDGTYEGTVQFFGMSRQGSNPSELTDVNGALFLKAYDGSGDALFTTTAPVDEAVREIRGWLHNMKEFSEANGLLYFSMNAAYYPDPNPGNEPWVSDGKYEGTHMVKNIASDLESQRIGSDPSEFTFMNGSVFFSAAPGDQPFDLWKTDGTEAGTVAVKDPSTASFINPVSLTSVGNKLFFLGENSQVGQELWDN